MIERVKQCSKCGQWKALDEFGKHPGSRDGLRGQCKPCHQPRKPGQTCDACDTRKTFENFEPLPDGTRSGTCRSCTTLPNDPRMCDTCEQFKPLAEFHRRKERGDGYLRDCISCIGVADPDRLRTCTSCGKPQPLSEYFRRSSGDGYRADCKTCRRANNLPAVRRYRAQNIEAARDSSRRSVARYRSENPEGWKAIIRRDYERNKARFFANNRKRRARLANVEHCEVIEKDLLRIMAEPCAHCGQPSEHLDHIIPISRGGRHSVGNLQGLCATCNTSKRDRLEVEVRYRGLLG